MPNVSAPRIIRRIASTTGDETRPLTAACLDKAVTKTIPVRLVDDSSRQTVLVLVTAVHESAVPGMKEYTGQDVETGCTVHLEHLGDHALLTIPDAVLLAA